jgi:ribosomal protein S18 acetylase RimI-like enzyme
MLSIEIRKARIKDIPQINELWKVLTSCHIEKCGYDRELFRHRRNSASAQKKFVGKCIRSRYSRVFVAEVDGEVIGYINASIRKLPPVYVHDKEVHINSVFIREGYRKKGIGRRLFREIERWAKEKGIFSIGLIVSIRNKSAFLSYRKLGFEEHHHKMSKEISP